MAKFYRHLYPQLYDWDNLLLAWRKARKGKRGRAPAAAFEQNAGEHLLAIQAELAERRDQPGGYASFYVPGIVVVTGGRCRLGPVRGANPAHAGHCGTDAGVAQQHYSGFRDTTDLTARLARIASSRTRSNLLFPLNPL
jgi:hypothetical protein